MADPSLPPLPPGFVLDTPQQPPAQSQTLPPLPEGFVLDSAPTPQQADNRSWLGRAGDAVAGWAGGAANAVTRTVKGGQLSDVYEVPATLVKNIATELPKALYRSGTLPGDVYSGKEDIGTPQGVDRAVELASFVNPMSAGSRLRQVGPQALRPIANEAAETGVTLTAGQRTANPALRSTEDAMLGGAHGPQAQNIAQAAREAQNLELRGARDAVSERLGTASDGTQVRLDRAADAGGIVGQRVDDVAAQAQAAVAARNAALQAERDALFRGAQSASESMGARFNPQGFAPVDAGGSVAAATRQAADRAKAGYQGAYRETFAREGQIDPEFFTGVNKPGSQSVMAPGAAVNEFAAPVSTRVKERLLSLDEPIIPDATVTPLASKTLDELDRVAALRLGRIGNPVPGQEVTGVNLRGIEQARKIITSRINAAKNNPQAAEDLRALRGIAKSFDEELERGFDSALFKGDSSVLDAMKGARGEFARYQQTFKQRARGDDAGAAIQKIVERNATPEEVSNYVLGASRVGDNGLSVRLYGRLKEMLGANSPQFQQIRGAAWEKLTAGADAATPAGAIKVAQGIQEFATGRGSTLAKQMFSADELASMQRYGNALRSFSAIAKNPVAKTEAEGAIKTLIDVAGQRMSPENMASALFGYGNKVTPMQHRLVDAVADVVGKDGPEWAAIRQGQWKRLTDVAEGKIEMGPQKLSQRIYEFLNGEGKSLAEKLYSPDELAAMRRYANIERARVSPPGTTNPSNSGNRLAGLAKQAMSGVLTMLGASQGGWAGAAIGMGAGKAAEGAAGLRAAAQARKLFAGEEPLSIRQRFAPAAGAAQRQLAPPVPVLLSSQGEVRK